MSDEKRPLKPALWDGFNRRCPSCHEGKLFDGYLAVNKLCPACNEDFTHQRADDGPAWATMLIVGHTVPPMLMAIYDFFEEPSPILVALFLGILLSLLTLYLLPRIKGLFIAVQWANRMHGFGNNGSKPQDENPYF